MQGENCNKLKLFPWGPWDGVVSAALAQANYIIEFCISFSVDIGPITPCNNFVFVQIDFQICLPDNLK